MTTGVVRLWTVKEKERVRDMRAAGLTVKAVADALGRTQASVRWVVRERRYVTQVRNPAAALRAARYQRRRGNVTDRRAAELFGVTVAGVRLARKKLGVKPPPNKTGAAAVRGRYAAERAASAGGGWPVTTAVPRRILEVVERAGEADGPAVAAIIGCHPKRACLNMAAMERAGFLSRVFRSRRAYYSLSPGVAERRREWKAVNGFVPD